MSSADDALVETMSADDAVTRLLRWWRGEVTGTPWTSLVDEGSVGGRSVLERVHAEVPDSVRLDVTGMTYEAVLRRVLEIAGLDPDAPYRQSWLLALPKVSDRRLVLLSHVQRMGQTRRSSEMRRLLTGNLPSSCRPQGLRVVAQFQTTTPLRLLREPTTGLAVTSAGRTVPPGAPEVLRALAYAEPRTVPPRVWAELVSTLGLDGWDAERLRRLAAESPAWFTLDPGGVAFADEGLAEAVRVDASAAAVRRVNRHLTRWLRDLAGELRHPAGWAAAGPVGAYAATGLAMHAVQAGDFDESPPGAYLQASHFEELLGDGGVLANLPPTALLDASSNAFIGAAPTNSAANDATCLWLYGVIPPEQPEWASWLQLMATARNDAAFAAAVQESGVALPWTARWARWRPPGGYHVSYLLPPADGLVEVGWRGRPAVASTYSWASEVTVRDVDTGELLAGPWRAEEIPAAYQADLSWPPDAARDSPAPTTFDQLQDAVPDGADVHWALLGCPPLPVGNLVILGGSGGMFALQPAPGTTFAGLNSPNVSPLSGPYAAGNAIRPVDAPPDSPADLLELFGPDCAYPFADEDVPAGLTDPATRRTLTEFGLPDLSDQWGLGIYPSGDYRFDVFDEVSWPDDLAAPTERGPFFQIGWWMGGELVVDGPTGHVLRVPTEAHEEHLAALPAAHSLENFLTMVALWITGLRTKATVSGDEAHQLQQSVEGSLWLVDQVGYAANAWSYVYYND